MYLRGLLQVDEARCTDADCPCYSYHRESDIVVGYQIALSMRQDVLLEHGTNTEVVDSFEAESNNLEHVDAKVDINKALVNH